MQEYKLPIYIETYRLIQAVILCTVKFPREYKFMLGNSLNNDILLLGGLILKANRSQHKSARIEEILIHLDKVRLQLRLSADFRLISCRQQARLTEMMEKITRQAIAWQKSEKKKELSDT